MRFTLKIVFNSLITHLLLKLNSLCHRTVFNIKQMFVDTLIYAETTVIYQYLLQLPLPLSGHFQSFDLRLSVKILQSDRLFELFFWVYIIYIFFVIQASQTVYPTPAENERTF